jgi:RNA polymerase sigma-70 factor (ECF subfamily)
MPRVDARPLDGGTRWSPGEARAGTLERRLEQHRAELTTFCRRMVGSCDAEDAVQETLVRAWRAFDRFEGRAALRSWLYRIAWNVCRDGLRARRRRARRMELTAQGMMRGPAAPRATPTAEAAIREGAVDTVLANPAETAVNREAVRLALAALMRLPPGQRAVLLLRDVLGWKAVEAAELLDTTVASVNSSLQRARSSLANWGPSSTNPGPPREMTQRQVLARYIDAFERYDLVGLCSIIREEARRPSRATGARGGRCRVS